MVRAESTPSSTIALRPRLAGPFGSIAFAAFLGLVGYITLEAGTWTGAWWIVVPIWGFAALQVWNGVKLLKYRKDLSLYVTPERVTIGDTTMRRSQVTAVRKYKDLHFKGVRVDFGPEAWLPISATHHEPGRVMRVFRQQGYPAE